MVKNRVYRSTGKWILAGEHSVLRGSRALVFPLPSLGMTLTYESSDHDLNVHFFGKTGENYQIIFNGLIDKALEILGRARGSIKGMVQLESDLPLGNGLGASAALCSVVGMWFADLGWVDSSKLEIFCRELENLFHGESSGVDVAVVLSKKPLYFSRFAPYEFLTVQWKPHLYLSPSGQKGLTHACIQKVKDFMQVHPTKSAQIDESMTHSVEVLKRLISTPPQKTEITSKTSALNQLGQAMNEMIRAINQARSCFEQWGLTEGALDREMANLQSLGALATKPTGSGCGGYVLSLWPQEPPESIRSQLISCW